MTSLLLLPRRSLTRSLWHEFNGIYLLFPSLLRSLALWSLLDWRWRRRRPDPAFLRPFQGSRTPPGLSSPRPLTSGSACPFLHPVTCLLHRLGCGPDGGSSVERTMVHGPPPATLPAGPPGPCGPSGLLAGPSTVGPSPVPPPTTPAADPQKTSPTPLRFRGFFPGATPPFIPTAPSSSVNTVAPTLTQQDAGTFSQGPTPKMIKGWKEEFMVDIRACWKQFVGDAPPQPTVGPAVTLENMGPDPLRQLSPSDDREASRAQHKTDSKWAGSNARRHSGSCERSSTDRHRARVRQPPASPDSSSPTRRLSPPAKGSRWDQRDISNDSSSSEGRQRSTRPRRPWQSRSPRPRHRDSSPSPSPHRRYRSSPAPSRCPSGANMTKRLAGRPSLSPRRRSSSHHRRSCDHPGAVSHHLRPAPGALIIGWFHHPLSRLHLKGIGPLVPLHGVTAPGFPARSVALTLMTQTFAFCDSVWTMMTSIPPVPIHVIPLIQDNLPQWMHLNYPRKKCRNFLLISLLLQLSRTMRIPYLIVLQTNNWYPMSGLLLPLLQLSITVNHWRLMDCSKTISPSIASLEILRRRHVRLRTMIWLT